MNALVVPVQNHIIIRLKNPVNSVREVSKHRIGSMEPVHLAQKKSQSGMGKNVSHVLIGVHLGLIGRENNALNAL